MGKKRRNMEAIYIVASMDRSNQNFRFLQARAIINRISTGESLVRHSRKPLSLILVKTR